ncbi:MAG: hypothetical protein R3B70_26105 [Polyangiaceae bacterium]
MSDAPETEVLLWDIEVLDTEGPRRFGALDVEMLDAETRFAVLGAAGDWPYLHIATDDDTRLITELCLVDAGAASLSPDTPARVPQEGAWLRVAAPAKVRVVGARDILSREQLAEILGGHGPPPVKTTTGNS